MNNIIVFPTKVRVASNDSNTWLSADPLPNLEPESLPEPTLSDGLPPGMHIETFVDKLSGVEYSQVVFDDEKPKPRAGLFIGWTSFWLILFALV